MNIPLLDGRSLQASLVTEFEDASVRLIDRVLRHPFLERCANGKITLDELRSFLIQHGKYTKFSTRLLCALISQLDEDTDVLELVENLTEELGFGIDADTHTPRSRIYADMLKDFNIDLSPHSTNPETQNLIDTMFMLCRQPMGTAGLGAICLGVEGLVPAVYGRIVEGFRRREVDIRRLEFFTIHIESADDHAATMHQILARQADTSPFCRITALSAGDVAVSARLRFFDALA